MKLSRLPSKLGRGTALALLVIGAFAVVLILLGPVGRRASAAIDRCAVPADVVALSAPLPRTAERLAEGGTLTIVALGSSSTAGTGASKPEKAYPGRLAVFLQEQFPHLRIRVVNRGIGGEMAPAMAARIEREVLAEKPDLVIWQLGTNSVLRDLDPLAELDAVRHGIARLRAAGSDVLLLDLQYAPAVLLHPRYREMLQLLSAVARAEDVPIFHRFAMMRHWAEDGRMTIPVMLGADRLHMTDASYDCLARQIGRSIIDTAAAHPEHES